MQSWYLEGYFSDDGILHRQPLKEFPFVMGRQSGLTLTIPSRSMSRRHARLYIEESQLILEDLGSTNGTFKNHERIENPTAVSHGDIIHLGEVEMRLMARHAEIQELGDDITVWSQEDKTLSKNFPQGASEFEKMLAAGEVTNAFQTIVNRDNSSIVGYEVLGRGASDTLPTSPGALFGIAESIGMEVQLSEMMRNTGVATAARLGLYGYLFINTHPSELRDPERLLRSLYDLRKAYPETRMALEIHELAISNVADLKTITTEMRGLNILIAYDDFGVGQSRLLELVEATPDILKFDMQLTSDIHLAEASKLELVKQLREVASKLKIRTIAECVSKKEEYEVCKNLGFDFFQGYFFDMPKTPDEF